MQFALLIYESPEAFASRKDEIDAYTGAWRSYTRLRRRRRPVGGDSATSPETGTRYELRRIAACAGRPIC